MFEKENNDLLKQINEAIQKINVRQEVNEQSSERNKLLGRADRNVESSLNQIQNSYDRIHDKAFNLNSGLIAAYLALGVFPNGSPILNIWTVIFPMINLAYIIFIEYKQMEIHRFASNLSKWTSVDFENHEKKIRNHTLHSFFALVVSMLCLIYLVVKLVF